MKLFNISFFCRFCIISIIGYRGGRQKEVDYVCAGVNLRRRMSCAQIEIRVKMAGNGGAISGTRV